MKTILAVVLTLTLSATTASAQDLVLSPSPAVVQRTTYYAPATVVAPQATTTYYSAPAPTTTYYSSPGTTTTYYAPTPTTTYYAPSTSTVVGPTVVGPTPVTSYYAPTVVARPTVTYYAPAAVPVTTYYAPTTTYYAPAVVTPTVVAPAGVVSTKVYYPGQPVRNFFKALAP